MRKFVLIAPALALAAAIGLSGLVPPAAAEEERRQRLDRNGDGKVGQFEARQGRRAFNRADRNDDGRLGKRERRQARRAFDRADRNGDGRLGKRERRQAVRTFDRIDRNFVTITVQLNAPSIVEQTLGCLLKDRADLTLVQGSELGMLIDEARARA